MLGWFFRLPCGSLMPILVVLIAVVALIYGAVKGFYALSATFGPDVAVGVAVLVGLLLVAAVGYGWRRRKEVAPNVHEGDWTHQLTGDWGSVRLAAGKRLCEIRLAGEEGDYIFADLVGADIVVDGRQWRLDVTVKDVRHQVWGLPMVGERQAKQWKRVFLLAIGQKL